eukprot:COSAG02_NODE_12502_length_1536_cov_0.938761_1_plen_45_part_00
MVEASADIKEGGEEGGEEGIKEGREEGGKDEHEALPGQLQAAAG